MKGDVAMSTVQAILIGACLIAGSVILSQGLPTAQASTGGPYQLMQHSNTTANVGVFRIDTSSGDVSYCFLTQSNELVCSKSVR